MARVLATLASAKGLAAKAGGMVALTLVAREAKLMMLGRAATTAGREEAKLMVLGKAATTAEREANLLAAATAAREANLLCMLAKAATTARGRQARAALAWAALARAALARAALARAALARVAPAAADKGNRLAKTPQVAENPDQKFSPRHPDGGGPAAPDPPGLVDGY